MSVWCASASASTVTVGYDPNAAEGNFGAPGAASDQVAYSISLTANATDIFGTITAEPSVGGTYNSNLQFANLYFGTGSSVNSTSDLGIEITNDRAFVPGVGGYYSLAGTGFSFTSDNVNGVITFTLPWAFLENDPLGMGFTTVSASDTDVLLRLSQSFGYSVAGGQANFGNDRLGRLSLPSEVPEPASMALLAAGLVGIGMVRRRA